MIVRLCIILALLCAPLARAADALQILCYHDVVDNLRGDLAADEYAVSTQHLVQQFNWLRENGYQVVSVEQVIASQRGGAPLPAKPVMLTFDDGYASTYSRVFPLLKLFNYPAVVAVVGKWVEDGQLPAPETGAAKVKAVSWEQLREMVSSGLIEVASHSHDLHQGAIANPQGNAQPALVARVLIGTSYESDTAYAERVRGDLAQNSALLAQRLGKAPRVMVWPYGRYNDTAQAIAADLGMPVSMNLDSQDELTADPSTWHRTLIYRNPKIKDFASSMRGPIAWGVPQSVKPQRALRVALDDVYSADALQQEKNLDRLLDNVKSMAITTVYLKAFHDREANGSADAVYFPNRHMPVRSDLFNRAAWQLAQRVGVKVIAWLPLTAFNVPGADDDWYSVPGVRLSPSQPRARQVITDVYEDLGRYANFNGLLFDEGLNQDAAENYLTQFTGQILSAVRQYRAPLISARSARVGDPVYAKLLPHYDYLILATPQAGVAREAQAQEVIAAVQRSTGGLEKTVFELRDEPSGRSQVVHAFARLQQAGAWHLAYAPYSHLIGLSEVRPALSAQSYPYRLP